MVDYKSSDFSRSAFRGFYLSTNCSRCKAQCLLASTISCSSDKETFVREYCSWLILRVSIDCVLDFKI